VLGSARRLRGLIGSVFRYAIVTLRATSDPTIATHSALLTPKDQHRAAIVDEAQLGVMALRPCVFASRISADNVDAGANVGIKCAPPGSSP
jgi:hypothetical protein